MALILAALAFAVVSGANDGATIVALNLSNRWIRPLPALVLLAVIVTAVPFLLGTEVATTVARRLVVFEGQTGHTALLVAVVTSVGVVAFLQRRGLPTSGTLALTGGIVGTGLGAGLPIGWGAVALTLGVGALAPLVGSGLAFAGQRVLVLLPRRGPAQARLQLLRGVAYVLQCVAYAANDGQKMLAVLAVGASSAAGGVAARPDQLLAIGGCFALGMLLGIPSFAGTLGQKVLLVRPPYAAVAELSSAAVVLGSAALGAPVSMTLSSAAALVGAGASDARPRVRWQQAARIVLAWFFTLPASAAAGALLAALGRRVA